MRKLLELLFAVFGAATALLLMLDNQTAYFPVALYHGRIYGLAHLQFLLENGGLATAKSKGFSWPLVSFH
ncbi:hypothetical protein [Marinobacter sp.]|uniref:hypothetical protein n=1 Tax=Marinobacter sp. TaxID=50741 RepID=UPI003F9BFFD5